MTDYKEIIKTKIDNSTGIKGVELSLAVMDVVNPAIFKFEEYWNAITELVESGEVMELEFVLPQIDYRTKSIYFPKGTTWDAPNHV